MQNGKLLSSQRNVVILSIKPKRPNYPTNQKLVPAREALKEWDKLDAYYRGQLLQLNDKSQKKSLKKKSKGKSSSYTKLYDEEDLFGDENSFYGDDYGQIKGDKDDYESDFDCYDDDKSYKSETKGVKCTSDEWEKKLDNYLAISKEDFTIRLDGSNKKRCWQRGKTAKMLRPVFTGNYRPPVAAGFNSIHIQKILYHKCTTESPERVSPGTTTTISSKESLKDFEKEKPAIKDVPKLRDSNSTVSNMKMAPGHYQPPITITKNKNTDLLSNSQKSNSSTNNTNIKDKSKHVDKKYKSCDNEHSSEEQKRKSDSERQKSKRKMDSESPVPVSSTSELFEKNSPANKKQKHSNASINDSGEGSENVPRQSSVNDNRESVTPTKGMESLVDTIVNQSRKSLQSVNKRDFDLRERQRNLEKKKRKHYALKKDQEQEELESIELAFKSFELILDFPPLSPIRSPPRWS